MTVAGGAIRTAADAGAWLEGLINHERAPGFRYARLDLEAIVALLERLGHPERDLSVVHVAGSKGKGSVCLLAESILGAAGERVGTFTSPHLERWTERFRIAGREVADADLAAAAEIVRPHVEALRRDEEVASPTFFDATTAIALVLFARAGVDRALIEVGLGGRLDSTNAIVPAVTVVTHIELEHTDKLGDTLAAIAAEKAGIIKPGAPCVIGALAPEAEQVVRETAGRVGSAVSALGSDFDIEYTTASAETPALPPATGRHFAYRESGFELDDLVLPLLGRHQPLNAALAIAAVRRLGAHDAQALAAAVERGLREAVLPGRLEVLGVRPTIIVDSAHTSASARSLAEVLAAIGAARRHLVVSISSDKPPDAILSALAPVSDEVWLTRADPIRSCQLDFLEARAAECMPRARRHCIEDPRDATRAAAAALGADDLLCCTGSVYLAGAARGVLVERLAGTRPSFTD